MTNRRTFLGWTTCILAAAIAGKTQASTSKPVEIKIKWNSSHCGGFYDHYMNVNGMCFGKLGWSRYIGGDELFYVSFNFPLVRQRDGYNLKWSNYTFATLEEAMEYAQQCAVDYLVEKYQIPFDNLVVIADQSQTIEFVRKEIDQYYTLKKMREEHNALTKKEFGG